MRGFVRRSSRRSGRGIGGALMLAAFCVLVTGSAAAAIFSAPPPCADPSVAEAHTAGTDGLTGGGPPYRTQSSRTPEKARALSCFLSHSSWEAEARAGLVPARFSQPDAMGQADTPIALSNCGYYPSLC